MPGKVSKQQRHVDPWESDMDVTEAMKVISNLKFEEEANVSVMLDPFNVHLWSRGYAGFLTKHAATSLIVENDEIQQSMTWLGFVPASDSCTSALGVRQAIELGVAETNERPRKALQDKDDYRTTRLVNFCRQKFSQLEEVASKFILDSLSKDPSAQFPSGLRDAVMTSLESEQLEHFDDPDRSKMHKTTHHILRVTMQMLAAFTPQARIVLEDELRNGRLPAENPAELAAFEQRSRRVCMQLVAMGVPAVTVSELLQQSIMRQHLQSVAGYELKRDIALKGSTIPLQETLSKIREWARTTTLIGALAGKGHGPIQPESGAMALQVGLKPKGDQRRPQLSERREKFCYNLLDEGACRKADCKFSHVPRCPKDQDGRCDDKSCKLAHDFRQARRKDRAGPTTPPRSGRAERSASPRTCFNCGAGDHVQRMCPRPKKEREPVKILATNTGADAREGDQRHDDQNYQYIFTSGRKDGTSDVQVVLDTSASAHFVGDSSFLEHPVRSGVIIHDSLGGTHAGSTGTFTFRAGGEISLRDVVTVPGSDDSGVSWRALTQSSDVAMVLDMDGGVVINSDGTQLMELSYDIDGLVIIRKILSDGSRSTQHMGPGWQGDSHVSVLINKRDDRPDLLSSTNSDNDSAEISPPPSPPPRERVIPEDGPPPLDLASATPTGGAEQNAFVLRAGMPREDDRWCAFDTAAAMPMTSDRDRICQGTRHQVDIDIVPYGAEATRVREAGTMLVRSRGKGFTVHQHATDGTRANYCGLERSGEQGVHLPPWGRRGRAV